MVLAREIPDLAWWHFNESAVAVSKEFGMVKDNFVTKNAYFEVKKIRNQNVD